MPPSAKKRKKLIQTPAKTVPGFEVEVLQRRTPTRKGETKQEIDYEQVRDLSAVTPHPMKKKRGPGRQRSAARLARDKAAVAAAAAEAKKTVDGEKEAQSGQGELSHHCQDAEGNRTEAAVLKNVGNRTPAPSEGQSGTNKSGSTKNLHPLSASQRGKTSQSSPPKADTDQSQAKSLPKSTRKKRVSETDDEEESILLSQIQKEVFKENRGRPTKKKKKKKKTKVKDIPPPPPPPVVVEPPAVPARAGPVPRYPAGEGAAALAALAAAGRLARPAGLAHPARALGAALRAECRAATADVGAFLGHERLLETLKKACQEMVVAVGKVETYSPMPDKVLEEADQAENAVSELKTLLSRYAEEERQWRELRALAAAAAAGDQEGAAAAAAEEEEEEEERAAAAAAREEAAGRLFFGRRGARAAAAAAAEEEEEGAGAGAGAGWRPEPLGLEETAGKVRELVEDMVLQVDTLKQQIKTLNYDCVQKAEVAQKRLFNTFKASQFAGYTEIENPASLIRNLA